MLFLILSLLVQAAFIVHVIKTGRNQLWIWVLIIPGLALAGILAYLVVEILPALFRSPAAQRDARRAHPSQPRFPLPDRASALCARARGRRQRPEGARGIRGARALLPGRRGLGALRAAPQGAGAGGRGAESGARAPRAGAHRAW